MRRRWSWGQALLMAWVVITAVHILWALVVEHDVEKSTGRLANLVLLLLITSFVARWADRETPSRRPPRPTRIEVRRGSGAGLVLGFEGEPSRERAVEVEVDGDYLGGSRVTRRWRSRSRRGATS